jgi:murein DD-endopeptidase MepM/ murein hydrolase activator NlpD
LERERQEALQREEEARRREEEAQAETQAAAQAVEDRRRARVEVVEAEQALQRLDLPVQQANAEFILPVSNASIASRYNESGPFIALRTNEDGAPVRAAIAGLVIEAALISANGGYLVTIQYAQQRCTVYTNLQPPRVAVGDHVSQGEIIGYLGGGALIRPDVLRFYVTTGSPCTTYTDPAPLLGIQ